MVVLLGVLGFAVNDSGVAIPLNATFIALPAAVAVCLRLEPPARGGRTPDDLGAHVTEDGEKPVDTPARAAGARANVLP
jgi:hypothetical protein